MTDKQETINQILHSGPLLELNFYQVNDSFFELEEDGFWIIDTGIELKFPSGFVSAAWNSELESYVLENDSVKNIYNQDHLFQLETENIKNLKEFVGLYVIKTNFKTLEFEFVVDYTMRTEKEKRFVELIIGFQNSTQIQIAFVDYVLEENEAPREFSFNLSSDLLISTKKRIEVKTLANKPSYEKP